AGQTEALNELWDHLRNKDKYEFGDWIRDVASLWERTYNMVEDMWSFPVRMGQEDRPVWVSLAWSQQVKSAPRDHVRLAERVEERLKPNPTDLEKLGKDSNGPAISKSQIKVSFDNNGSWLNVAIEGLVDHPPAEGHYVGFVVVPSIPRPIAILFLT